MMRSREMQKVGQMYGKKKEGSSFSAETYSEFDSGFSSNVNVTIGHPDDDEFVGIRTCQTKSVCTWGNIAPLLWHAAGREETCTGSMEDWLKRSDGLGFGP